ncbi:proline racemase family protein [Enterocloster bolteae]|uniref:proline racemase family protein n=1 Tax=Enterocloster bolteae TaxID=208479 RepID=UPI00210B86D5|nr:proline racemase family protein [Enterocloster bolteae]MCQ5146441.1 proline racemase family protein [Enterocloster bolteae]
MAKFNRMVRTVESHTGGQATKTIISGIPKLLGNTMAEKMQYCEKHEDWIRQMLTSEPRTDAHMSLTFLTEPCNKEADIGAFYAENVEYMPLCGHDTIGLGTVLVETGKVAVTEPETLIKVDTPNGLIELKVLVENGNAKSVTFRNAPAFTWGTDLEIEYGEKKVVFDVGFGGNFYAFVPAAMVGFKLIPEEYSQIVKSGLEIRKLINEKYKVQHPEQAYLNEVSHVMFVDDIRQIEGGIESKNAVVYLPGAIDRSPCGTGTSARTAVLNAKGILKQGMKFKHYSLIDSMFESNIVEVFSDYHGYPAVIPEITGNAFITGFGTWVTNPDDEKTLGFNLG